MLFMSMRCADGMSDDDDSCVQVDRTRVALVCELLLSEYWLFHHLLNTPSVAD